MVGRLQIGQSKCWEWVCGKVFKETEELMAGQPPQAPEDFLKVEGLLEDAKRWSRSTGRCDWMTAGFDLAVLIALRSYLSSRGGCGRMVFVCVGGDEWPAAIRSASNRFGIGPGSSVSNRLIWVHLES
jgi:hypothetical protein